MNTIPQVASTVNRSINAEFVRLEVPNGPDGGVYYFSSSYRAETITVDGNNETFVTDETEGSINVNSAVGTSSVYVSTFTPLGQLVNISGTQRDLSASSYDTTITLQGIDQTKVGVILSSSFYNTATNSYELVQLKGAKVNIWRGFYTDNYVLDGDPVLRYTGIVTGYNIVEDQLENQNTFTLQIHCSNYKLVLQNRIVGRHTNPRSWNTVNGQTILSTDPAYDAGMDNVAALNNATFNFGQKLA